MGPPGDPLAVFEHLRPGPDEYAPYYQRYVDAAGAGDPFVTLEAQASEAGVLAALTDAQAGFRYAPGKWSVREVVSHVCDAERVFTYRALRFARADEQALTGFDQEQWEVYTNADARPLAEIVAEFQAVRAATAHLFRSLAPEALKRGGVASDNYVSVRALLYIIAGHTAHHLGVLRDRYTSSPDFPR